MSAEALVALLLGGYGVMTTVIARLYWQGRTDADRRFADHETQCARALAAKDAQVEEWRRLALLGVHGTAKGVQGTPQGEAHDAAALFAAAEAEDRAPTAEEVRLELERLAGRLGRLEA